MKVRISKLGVVVHTCNASTQEAKAGGWGVSGQFKLHSKTPFQNAASPRKLVRTLHYMIHEYNENILKNDMHF
jgi:hypothetical protein